MWSYEKKLQYPVNIKNPNPKLAQMIISQYGILPLHFGLSLFCRCISGCHFLPESFRLK